MWLESLVLVGIAFYLFYCWVTLHYDHFEKRGLPYRKPVFLLGTMWELIFNKKAFLDIAHELYNEQDGPVYGIFDQRLPILLVRDPELIKQITIKDFDHFVNHRDVFGEEGNQNNLFGSSLFVMKDNRWRDMRNTLSPVFTGSKMRLMFDLMNKIAEESVAYLKQQDGVMTMTGVDMNVKDFVTRYTNDIIASTAFGIEVNSFVNANNEFYLNGKKLTNFGFAQNLKFFCFANFKKVMRLLRIELFDKKISDYFFKLVIDAMKYRKENNIIRPDMIHMLMEARGMIPSDNPKTCNREWTDIEIAAQCFLFFFAGFETTATLACITFHEIMENPDIQAKLLEEIEDVLQTLDDKQLTYNSLQNMPYMDAVISETLRKWAAAPFLDRLCTKDITYDLGNGKKLEFRKGDVLWIPVYGLHRDPNHFENPEKFDPQRFHPDNKGNIKPFTYMPFGSGPRLCIASRFALLEQKVLLFHLLKNFQLKAAEKSCIPLKMGGRGFQFLPKNGFWLKFVARN